MPTYTYRVGAELERLDVVHPMKNDPQTWGELAAVAGLDVQRHPADTPVERLIAPVRAQVSQFTSDLRNQGFKKLHKRSDGVYEDVTAPKGERIVDPRNA